MPGITSNEQATTIARAGVGRALSMRAGFAPKDVTEDGTSYVWEPVDMPTATWTEDRS